MQLDAKAMAAATADIVQAHVSPLLKRIEALEGRPAAERGEKGEPGERGHQGESGVGLAGALIDRSGVLILTLSNGETRELGPVVGKDGTDGKDGADGRDGAAGIDGVDGPPGKDGADGAAGPDGKDGVDGEKGIDGKDGADGLGFDDLGFEHDGERCFKLIFEKGDRRREFAFEVPVMLDRGVYRDGETYKQGDVVTWAGSLWIAQKETASKPDSGDGWRLSVKRGRDGKDAKPA